mgnify:CR=1 FL=1
MNGIETRQEKGKHIVSPRKMATLIFIILSSHHIVDKQIFIKENNHVNKNVNE